MNVIILPEVAEYLDELTNVLYNKGYFGFIESAKDYTDRLTDYIVDNISHKTKHKAPRYFNRYGKEMYYITFKPNQRTTWYIFFQIREDRYLIRYITNNHISAHHIRSLK